MALRTEGFSLRAMPRAPDIPKNIGQVDVKSIYDGVRQGLENFELARRAPQSMILADAEMAAKTAQAPLATRAALAQTEGIEQQTPLKTAILASEASPEYIAAKREALTARATKPLTGDAFLLNRRDELRRHLQANPTDNAVAQALEDTELLINKRGAVAPSDPQAAIDARVSNNAATNASRESVAAAGNTSREGIAAGNNTTREGIAAQTDETKRLVAENTDLRVRELSANVDLLKRELAEQKRVSDEKMATERNTATTARNMDSQISALEAAADAADAVGDTSLAAANREGIKKLTTHASGDSDAAWLAAFAARPKKGGKTAPAAVAPAAPAAAAPATTAAPVTPTGEWTEVTLPSGVKVRVRKKQ